MQENYRSLGQELAGKVTEFAAFLSQELPEAAEVLAEYVNTRRAISGDDTESLIAHSVYVVGSALELAPELGASKYNDTTLPEWAYKADNPLSLILRNAELYGALDFDWDYYYNAESNAGLGVLSASDLACISGRSEGGIRNALSEGTIVSVRFDSVIDSHRKPVAQKVFITYEEARRWLNENNLFEDVGSVSDNASNLFELIRNFGSQFDGNNLPDFLKLREKGDLAVYYAPFEYVNTSAKVVICGITPGAYQAEIALNRLAEELVNGASVQDALRAAKSVASFSGSMRNSLIQMLDCVGLNEKLGIESCRDLFENRSDLVHFTSALRNPVFFRGGNYSGNPLMLSDSLLLSQIEEYLVEEISMLDSDVFYIPLGPKPAEALLHLARKGLLDESRILDGIPHPSGANAERIAYFCGDKEKSSLSSRTNADRIDSYKKILREKIEGSIFSDNLGCERVQSRECVSFEDSSVVKDESDNFCRRLVFVRSDGRKVYPVKMLDRQSNVKSYRLSKGSNLKADTTFLTDEDALIGMILNKGYSVRMAGQEGGPANLLNIRSKSVVGVYLDGVEVRV